MQIKDELLKITVYPPRKCKDMLLEDPLLPSLTYMAAAQLAALSSDPSVRSVGLWAVGRSMPVTEDVVTIGSVMFTKKQLYTESINLMPNFSYPYNNLGNIIGLAETVRFSDGRTLTKRLLYAEAIKSKPTNGSSYTNLGLCLERHQSQELLDGRVMMRRELFLEGMRQDPCDSSSYTCLGWDLEAEEIVSLPDGRSMGKRQLYEEALMLDEDNKYAFDRVKELMVPSDTWHRSRHRLYGHDTNVLFALLLMGLQRLEEAQVLPMAHHSMLEDMLEGFTWRDRIVINAANFL